MQVEITSDVLMTEYDRDRVGAEFAVSYIRGAEPYIVPGVTSWDNVTADMPDPATLVIRADLKTEDVVSSGDFRGQEVTPEWVQGYVIGADAYWLAPGVLKATKVLVTSNND